MKPKGYWIVQVDIDDLDRYQNYIAANGEPLAAFGARFIVRSGENQTVEGKARSRIVVLEFPTYQLALDCWNSDAYQKALALRTPVSTADLTIIEGYAGPQPEGS